MQIKFVAIITLLTTITISYADDQTQPKPIPSISQQQKQTTPANDAQNITPSIPQAINCEYKISAKDEIKNSLVINWSEKAAVQSFNYNNANIDNKLQDLKNCFTDQGYISYTDALKKSGNIEAIKTQQLSVNSFVDGKTKINKLEDNKWQLKVPLQVTYQNNQEKLTQLLFVDLLVTRKVSGNLGIAQIIAAPRDKIIEKKL